MFCGDCNVKIVKIAEITEQPSAATQVEKELNRQVRQEHSAAFGRNQIRGCHPERTREGSVFGRSGPDASEYLSMTFAEAAEVGNPCCASAPEIFAERAKVDG